MTNEQKEQFKAALAAAIERRRELTLAREEIEKELAQQNKAISALSEIVGEAAELEVGLTDATLLAVRSSPAAIPATKIRDKLREMGFDIDRFSNPMASLHQVLIRLFERGDIIIKTYKGKKYFLGAGRKLDTQRIDEALAEIERNFGRKSK